MRFQAIFINIFLLISIPSLTSTSENPTSSAEWEKVTQTDSWTVYTRDSETSAVKEVKVEGVMAANFDAVMKAMTDIEAYPDWVYSCIDSYKFDVLSDIEFHSYTKTNLPFPLQDRDLVVHTSLNTEVEGEWQTISDARPIKLPNVDAAVRIEQYHAEWKMKAKNDNSIDFVYMLAMEPGGLLPSWIVNMAIDKIPINTITSLEKRSIEIMNQ